jgi:hypothetical protein
MALDWTRVRFTEHMTEAAAVVAECHIVLDFGTGDRTTYAVKVFRDLKPGGADPYFAVGANPDDPGGFRPARGGATPEAALQACLDAAGVHQRRRVKQAGE